MNSKRAFSTAEAATYISLSESYLRQARMTASSKKELDAPAHTKLGAKKVVYLKEDLDSWLDAHKAASQEVA